MGKRERDFLVSFCLWDENWRKQIKSSMVGSRLGSVKDSTYYTQDNGRTELSSPNGNSNS